MRKFLIASHAQLAQGFLSAANLICGEIERISFINAYIDEISLKTQLDQYFSTVTKEDEVIVMTDLVFGSVNNECVPYIASHGIKLLSGVNLALILSLLTEEESTIFDDAFLEKCISEAKDQIKYINTSLKSSHYEDDFDF